MKFLSEIKLLLRTQKNIKKALLLTIFINLPITQRIINHQATLKKRIRYSNNNKSTLAISKL